MNTRTVCVSEPASPLHVSELHNPVYNVSSKLPIFSLSAPVKDTYLRLPSTSDKIYLSCGFGMLATDELTLQVRLCLAVGIRTRSDTESVFFMLVMC